MPTQARAHIGQIKKSIVAGENPVSLIHTMRTTVAAAGSYVITRSLHLPEPFWAPISALIVMQSTLGSTLPVSVQRFAGTAAGAAIGGILATYLNCSVWTFVLAMVLLGVGCALFNVERSAYRYAGITLAIILLVPRPNTPWILAFHRFVEVGVGIAVGLVMSAVWPERQSLKNG